MSDTPRMDLALRKAQEDCTESYLLTEGLKLERELNTANERIKRMEEALGCVVVGCDYLHHRKKHQHRSGEPCPVEELIRQAKEAKP